MKQNYIALTVLIIIGLMAFNQKQTENKPDELKNKNLSPLEGNWITVSFEQNGKKTKPKKSTPSSLKCFTTGIFH
jgi:hypothetical protein